MWRCPSCLRTDGTTPMHPPPNRPTNQPPAPLPLPSPSPPPPPNPRIEPPFASPNAPRARNPSSVVLQVPSPLKHRVSAKVFLPFIYLIELRNAISHECNPKPTHCPPPPSSFHSFSVSIALSLPTPFRILRCRTRAATTRAKFHRENSTENRTSFRSDTRRCGSLHGNFIATDETPRCTFVPLPPPLPRRI